MYKFSFSIDLHETQKKMYVNLGLSWTMDITFAARMWKVHGAQS